MLRERPLNDKGGGVDCFEKNFSAWVSEQKNIPARIHEKNIAARIAVHNYVLLRVHGNVFQPKSKMRQKTLWLRQ